jgi:hypothetical protein
VGSLTRHSCERRHFRRRVEVRPFVVVVGHPFVEFVGLESVVVACCRRAPLVRCCRGGLDVPWRVDFNG